MNHRSMSSAEIFLLSFRPSLCNRLLEIFSGIFPQAPETNLLSISAFREAHSVLSPLIGSNILYPSVQTRNYLPGLLPFLKSPHLEVTKACSVFLSISSFSFPAFPLLHLSSSPQHFSPSFLQWPIYRRLCFQFFLLLEPILQIIK